MKTPVRFLLAAAAALVLAQTPLRAEEKPPAPKAKAKAAVPETFGMNMFPKINSTKMNLLIENQYGIKLHIKLLNEKNEVLYNETIGRKQTKYWRKFDMGQLKDGHYRFEVSNGVETQSREVDLSTKQPVVPNERLISFRN
jgi:hypothetical protein